MQDKKLTSIIHEYISNKGMARTSGCVDEMVRDIMRTHREYGRKQIKPFTKYVKEVYDHICCNRNDDVKSPGLKVKRNSPEKEMAPYSKRMRVEEDQLTSVQGRKPINTGVDLMSAFFVERYKMNSMAQSSVSDNHASSPVTDIGNLFVIDRAADTPGTVCSVPADDSRPDLPVSVADLPSSAQVSSKQVESGSMINEKSPVSNKTDQVPKPISYKSTEQAATNASSSAVPKKRKIRRTNEEDPLNRLLDRKTLFDVEESSVRLKDYPALGKMLSVSIRKDIFSSRTNRGIILTGPKGCGKSMLAEAIVGRFKIPFIRVKARKIPRSQNESKEFVDDLVEQAVSASPCALIIEDVPHKPNSESSKTDNLLKNLLEDMFEEVNKNKRQIWIVATALSITSDEVPIGKDGFQVVVAMRQPDDLAKIEILNAMVKRCGVNLEPGLNFQQIVQDTPAFGPGDLENLVDKAVLTAKLRTYEERRLAGELMSTDDDDDDEYTPYIMARELNDATLTAGDFQLAVKDITPAARDGAFFLERPTVKWDEDIGGMEELRKQFVDDFLLPITRPELYEDFEEARRPTGIILHGPPGCGKTLMAKAMASEASMNFLSIKGPELLRMYLGESERMLREVFDRAKEAAPSVVFLDEIDSLCQDRDSNEGGTKFNLVAQLLPLLDGITDRGGVHVIGSTNRLDHIDKALLRPGRLGTHLHVGLPNAEQRYKILLAITKKTVLASDVKLKELAEDPRCKNLSGADLKELILRAGKNRARHRLEEGAINERGIFKVDIEDALNWFLKLQHRARMMKLKKRKNPLKSSKSS